MTPAVTFTDPGKFLSCVQPAEVVADVEPSLVLLRQHGAHVACFRITQDYPIRVLESIQLLEHDGFRAVSPVHPCDVVVARVTGHI